MMSQKLGGEKKTNQTQFERNCRKIEIDRKLSEALTRVLDRMGTKNEALGEAIEAVYPDYGGTDFAELLEAYAQGRR